MQDRRRPDDRMPCERQFLEQVEDSGTNSAGLIRRLEEDRFEMPHLLGDPQHLFCGQVRSIGKHRQAVAAEWNSAEHVDVSVIEVHLISVTAQT